MFQQIVATLRHKTEGQILKILLMITSVLRVMSLKDTSYGLNTNFYHVS